MISIILLVYIIGVIIHYYGFRYDHNKEREVILDLPEVKEMDSLFSMFSILWPVFWIVFIWLLIEQFFDNIKNK